MTDYDDFSEWQEKIMDIGCRLNDEGLVFIDDKKGNCRKSTLKYAAI